MRGHFRYLRFKTFSMTPRTFQCEVFWALLLNPKHSGVLEDSKSPTLGMLGFTPTLGQSGVTTDTFFHLTTYCSPTHMVLSHPKDTFDLTHWTCVLWSCIWGDRLIFYLYAFHPYWMISTWRHGKLGFPQKLLAIIKDKWFHKIYSPPCKARHTLVLINILWY